jgi:isopentenyl-diphosphate delta-isomerase
MSSTSKLIEYVYRFCYEAGFGGAGSENELCHVFLGKSIEDIQPNESEISSIRYITADDLAKELEQHPDSFTPWFKQEWQELNGNYTEQLARYCAV